MLTPADRSSTDSFLKRHLGYIGCDYKDGGCGNDRQEDSRATNQICCKTWTVRDLSWQHELKSDIVKRRYSLSKRVMVPSKSVKKMNLGFVFIAGSDWAMMYVMCDD